MKIVVGYPPTFSEKGTVLLSQNRQLQWFNNPTFLFPVTLGTAATWLRNKGHQVFWKDAIAENLSMEEFISFLKTEQPDLFFFESKSPVIKKHWAIIDLLKKEVPHMKIGLCGDHVSYLPRESMENSTVDYVFNGGYYDFAMVELVDAIVEGKKPPVGVWYRENGNIVDNGRYNFTRHLDEAPIIDRVFTKNDLYQKEFNLKGRPFAYIMSGRDCWYGKCTFCVWDHTLYPKGTFRARTPENVMEEVKYLVDKIGVKEIFDDAGTITVGPWLRKFCNLMIESGYNEKVMYSCNMRFGAVTPQEYKLMKRAGFRLLKYGLEGGTQQTLDKLDKGTKIEEIIPSARAAKAAGLTVHLTMMVGYPWETRDDAMATLNLAKELMHQGYADILQSTVVMPYPGTPLYKEASEKGWLLIDQYDYERLDMTEPILATPYVSREEIMKICDRIYTDIFFNPKYVYQHLKKIKSWEDIVYTARGVKAVLGHVKDFSRPVAETKTENRATAATAMKF